MHLYAALAAVCAAHQSESHISAAEAGSENFAAGPASLAEAHGLSALETLEALCGLVADAGETRATLHAQSAHGRAESASAAGCVGLERQGGSGSRAGPGQLASEPGRRWRAHGSGGPVTRIAGCEAQLLGPALVSLLARALRCLEALPGAHRLGEEVAQLAATRAHIEAGGVQGTGVGQGESSGARDGGEPPANGLGPCQAGAGRQCKDTAGRLLACALHLYRVTAPHIHPAAELPGADPSDSEDGETPRVWAQLSAAMRRTLSAAVASAVGGGGGGGVDGPGRSRCDRGQAIAERRRLRKYIMSAMTRCLCAHDGEDGLGAADGLLGPRAMLTGPGPLPSAHAEHPRHRLVAAPSPWPNRLPEDSGAAAPTCSRASGSDVCPGRTRGGRGVSGSGRQAGGGGSEALKGTRGVAANCGVNAGEEAAVECGEGLEHEAQACRLAAVIDWEPASLVDEVLGQLYAEARGAEGCVATLQAQLDLLAALLRQPPPRCMAAPLARRVMGALVGPGRPESESVMVGVATARSVGVWAESRHAGNPQVVKRLFKVLETVLSRLPLELEQLCISCLRAAVSALQGRGPGPEAIVQGCEALVGGCMFPPLERPATRNAALRWCLGLLMKTGGGEGDKEGSASVEMERQSGQVAIRQVESEDDDTRDSDDSDGVGDEEGGGGGSSLDGGSRAETAARPIGAVNRPNPHLSARPAAASKLSRRAEVAQAVAAVVCAAAAATVYEPVGREGAAADGGGPSWDSKADGDGKAAVQHAQAQDGSAESHEDSEGSHDGHLYRPVTPGRDDMDGARRSEGVSKGTWRLLSQLTTQLLRCTTASARAAARRWTGRDCVPGWTAAASSDGAPRGAHHAEVGAQEAGPRQGPARSQKLLLRTAGRGDEARYETGAAAVAEERAARESEERGELVALAREALRAAAGLRRAGNTGWGGAAEYAADEAAAAVWEACGWAAEPPPSWWAEVRPRLGAWAPPPAPQPERGGLDTGEAAPRQAAGSGCVARPVAGPGRVVEESAGATAHLGSGWRRVGAKKRARIGSENAYVRACLLAQGADDSDGFSDLEDFIECRPGKRY
jgi:hypothetical protein